MGIRLRILAVLALLLAVLSCGKDGPAGRQTAPEGFRDLIAACQSGMEFHGLTVGANSTEFRFGEDVSIFIPISQLLVYDCSNSIPKVVGVDADMQWTVAGRPTGIYKDPKVADIDALPVYVYLKGNDLHICLSNGNKLEIKYVSPRTVVTDNSPAPSLPSGLPVVYVTTEHGAPVDSKEYYVPATIRVESPDTYFWNVKFFETSCRIRGRGNSTWQLDKKPYKLKLDDKFGMFGMNRNKDWCLIANYSDKTLLRNRVGMRLSEIAGFSWTPGNVPVELYLNDEYMGTFDFFEHKEVAKGKVDIDVEAGDIYFEIEDLQDNPVCWWTKHSVPLMFSDPENPSAGQVQAAKAWFQGFEDALWRGDFTDRTDHYSDYIDVASFINFYIVQELTKNVDADLAKSIFLTWKKGQKLEMYHLWDFDLILGNCNYYDDGLEPWEGWWIRDRLIGLVGHGWFYHLFMDPAFVAGVKARWKDLYPELLTIPGYIDAQVEILGDAPAHNFERWPIMNTVVWPNYKICGSYEAEVEWLKECYLKRLDWLNRELLAL